MQHLRRPGQPGPLNRHPFVRGVLVVLALLSAVTAVAWFAIVPAHRPALSGGEAHGVDVSNHQGVIDWSAVAADGIGFAYLKSTEGRGYVDPFFARNWTGAQQAGVRRGAYHFFTLCAPGAEQAANFLRVAPPDPDALPPAVDLEVLSDNCTDRPSAPEVEQQLTEFVTAVERGWGRELLVYARGSWTDLYPLPTAVRERARWRTSFFVRPRADWAVWQVHYWAHVDGIEGRVDLDVLHADRL